MRRRLFRKQVQDGGNQPAFFPTLWSNYPSSPKGKLPVGSSGEPGHRRVAGENLREISYHLNQSRRPLARVTHEQEMAGYAGPQVMLRDGESASDTRSAPPRPEIQAAEQAG